MHAARILNALGMSRLAPALALGFPAIATLFGPIGVRPWTAMLLALVALGWIAWQQHMLRNIVTRLAGPRADAGQPVARAVDEALSRIEGQLAALQHRTLDTHPVSGLPLREALSRRVEQDGRGLLGVIAFTDVDRLSAFDPALADRIMAECSGRLRAMLPASRFLAQIDRGHIGVWFAEGLDDAQAWAELDAVAYALGAQVDDGVSNIVPQVTFRLSRFEPDAGAAPPAFIARTLACLALPDRPAAALVSPRDEAAAARERFGLEQDLRQAIDRRELRLVYQPLIDAAQGRVAGAEALLRWDHPVRGAISPARFVPLLEAIGLAGEIGGWVLNTALREARRWDALRLPPMRVAVNVSALQLNGGDLPGLVARTLELHGVAASRLEIELTESVATSDAAHCRRIFQALRTLGVKLAVDDFGTGYSGFSSLRTLAFDKIKIDREFVTHIDTRADSQAICQSIIALGRGLGIRVLAEGVERPEEYAWLREHGCDHFQGYHFARPMAADAFIAFAQQPAALAGLPTPHPFPERLSA